MSSKRKIPHFHPLWASMYLQEMPGPSRKMRELVSYDNFSKITQIPRMAKEKISLVHSFLFGRVKNVELMTVKKKTVKNLRKPIFFACFLFSLFGDFWTPLHFRKNTLETYDFICAWVESIDLSRKKNSCTIPSHVPWN